jgi:ATP-dependent Clp protease protease subunit
VGAAVCGPEDATLSTGTDSPVVTADEIIKTRAVLNDILAHHTGQPIEQIAKDTDRDRYLSATEAKEYGIVDEILTKPPVTAEETDKD